MQFVAGFMVSESREFVLLIRKQKPDWQKGKLNGVGGKVEKGETPIQAMIREFHEEVGFKINRPWDLRLSLVGHKDWEVHFFVNFFPDIWNMIPGNQEHGEKTEAFRLDCLWESGSVIPNLKWIIPYCLDLNAQYARIRRT